jgi:uncharacterized protein (TIRG00374 family)
MEKRHKIGSDGLKISRATLPILIGLAVIVYLFWKQFDWEEFKEIDWSNRTFFWLLVAIFVGILRHLAYSWRLHHLSLKKFSWKKSIELIFIWEFSSAVSPTSLGGSAVAFFILSKEKLSIAKTATIVLYTIVLDSFFLLGTLPILYLVFGSSIMRPDELGNWGFYFALAYLLMTLYSAVFFYGLFVNPQQLKKLLLWITSFKFLDKWKATGKQLGDDIILASRELSKKPFSFHFISGFSTTIAWVSRFIILNCIMIALLPDLSLYPTVQFELYARLQTMFFVIAFSPTPGGAGLIELLFNGFLTDYIQTNTSTTIISTIWRILSYYIYLIAGAIIIPNWLQKIWRKKPLNS